MSRRRGAQYVLGDVGHCAVEVLVRPGVEVGQGNLQGWAGFVVTAIVPQPRPGIAPARWVRLEPRPRDTNVPLDERHRCSRQHRRTGGESLQLWGYLRLTAPPAVPCGQC